MVLILATSAARLRELDSTIAVVTVALLIALIFQARFFDFRRHHASEPRLMVGLMGALAAIFLLSEGAALLGMLASDPRLLTKISATGLVLLFALVLALVFELWRDGLREHARERHHDGQVESAERAVEWAQRAVAGGAAVAIAALWWLPFG